MTTPTPTPSAEAMTIARLLNCEEVNESAVVIDAAFVPLRTDLEAARRENERLTDSLEALSRDVHKLGSDNQYIVTDRDALRTRVAELKDKLLIQEARDNALCDRITALETANKALEADKVRLRAALVNAKHAFGAITEFEGVPTLVERERIDAAIAQGGGQ